MAPSIRLREFERLDLWLRACTPWRLRQLAFAIALTINVPHAWGLYRFAPGPAAVSVDPVVHGRAAE